MGNIRVLIVDDHSIFRAGLAQFLSKEDDIDCIGMAESGEEAVRIAVETHPDIVILDIAMPVMDGITATKHIRSACPSTAILVLSAYQYASYVLASLRAGVKGYLLKSASPDEVVNAIRIIHAGNTVYSVKAVGRVFGNLANIPTEKILGFNELHEREIEVLRLAALAMSNKEIAYSLKISEHTVRSHIVSIFRKLGVGSRTEAALCALRAGLITLDDR